MERWQTDLALHEGNAGSETWNLEDHVRVLIGEAEVQTIAEFLQKSMYKPVQALKLAKDLKKRARDTKTTEAYEQAANEHTRDGELEVDPGAVVSLGDDDGAYVQSWLWVDKADMRRVRREMKKLCDVQSSVPKTSSDPKTPA